MDEGTLAFLAVNSFIMPSLTPQSRENHLHLACLQLSTNGCNLRKDKNYLPDIPSFKGTSWTTPSPPHPPQSMMHDAWVNPWHTRYYKLQNTHYTLMLFLQLLLKVLPSMWTPPPPRLCSEFGYLASFMWSSPNLIAGANSHPHHGGFRCSLEQKKWPPKIFPSLLKFWPVPHTQCLWQPQVNYNSSLHALLVVFQLH